MKNWRTWLLGMKWVTLALLGLSVFFGLLEQATSRFYMFDGRVFFEALGFLVLDTLWIFAMLAIATLFSLITVGILVWILAHISLALEGLRDRKVSRSGS